MTAFKEQFAKDLAYRYKRWTQRKDPYTFMSYHVTSKTKEAFFLSHFARQFFALTGDNDQHIRSRANELVDTLKCLSAFPKRLKDPGSALDHKYRLLISGDIISLLYQVLTHNLNVNTNGLTHIFLHEFDENGNGTNIQKEHRITMDKDTAVFIVNTMIDFYEKEV